MGARQAYAVINCLIYLVLCLFGVIALFLRVIAVVAVNPVIVSRLVEIRIGAQGRGTSLDLHWTVHLCRDSLADS